jgi:hypothetical protein
LVNNRIFYIYELIFLLTGSFYRKLMKILLKIYILTLFLLSAAPCIAQDANAQEETREGKSEKRESATDSKDANPGTGKEGQDQNSGKRKGSVKQVKSARPDMSKSRGARPPDIVRPSGSRIPKGVGRPAGAGRHGRG